MHDFNFYLNRNGNFPIFFNAIPVPLATECRGPSDMWK